MSGTRERPAEDGTNPRPANEGGISTGRKMLLLSVAGILSAVAEYQRSDGLYVPLLRTLTHVASSKSNDDVYDERYLQLPTPEQSDGPIITVENFDTGKKVYLTVTRDGDSKIRVANPTFIVKFMQRDDQK